MGFSLVGSCAGALELWELAEDERLLVNRFTKHEHDHIVTTVSPVTGANGAVTGSMDCRLDTILHGYTQLQNRSMSIVCVELWHYDFGSHFFHPFLITMHFPLLHYRVKVWDLSQETAVTTYNGKGTSQNCSQYIYCI